MNHLELDKTIVLKKMHGLVHIKRHILLVCSILCLFSSLPAHAFKVLFVGNSFVGYSKNTLQSFAQHSPYEDEFGYEFVGGISLIEHARRESTLTRIREQRWDYVVLQDHSLQTLRHPDSFRAGLEILINEIRNSGAEPILFMTWARLQSGNYLGDQKTVSAAYLDAGIEHNASVARVGDVFLDRYRNDSNLFFRMFDEDGIHPTSFGTFAVAASVYKVMYNDSMGWAPTSGVGAAGDRLRAAAVGINTTRPAHYNSAGLHSLIFFPTIYQLLL